MVQQRLDLLSPLQGVLKRLAEDVKAIIPDKVRVQMEMEADTKSVEDSFSRLRGASQYGTPIGPEPMSAVQRVKAGMGSEGPEQDVAGTLESIRRVATQIAYYQDRIDNKKGSVAHSLEQIERLEGKLEKLATSGKKAADALGGDDGKSLATEIDKAKNAAKMGEGGLEPGEGDGDSGSRARLQFQRMLRDPAGAGMQWLRDSFFGSAIGKRLLGYGTADLGALMSGEMGAGGIAAGTTGMVLGAPLALYGGLKGGDAINMHFANKAQQDLAGMVADTRLSAAIGRDFRGEFYEPGRMRSRQGFNMPEVRQAVGASGISYKNFQGDFGQAMQSIVDASLVTGVDSGSLGSIMGTAVRSGGMDANNGQVLLLMGRIAGAVETSASQGIAANEKLGTIAALNQKTAAEAGFLTPELMKLNFGISQAFDQTGDKAFEGQQGLGMMGILAGARGQGAAGARQVGMMLDQHGGLLPEFQQLIDKDPRLKGQMQGLPAWMQAQQLLGIEGVSDVVNQRALKRFGGDALGRTLFASLLGIQAGTLRGNRAVYGATNELGDLGTQDIALGDFNGAKGLRDATDEGQRAQRAMSELQREVRVSGGSPELYQEQAAFHNDMRNFGNQVVHSLDNLTSALLSQSRGH